MAKLRVAAFSVTLDGYGAGPEKSLDNPLGDGGTTGGDESFAARSFENVGSWILGRNMFGPVRGPWPDDTWKGWWGDTPPYHCDVFVLTHHARASITL